MMKVDGGSWDEDDIENIAHGTISGLIGTAAGVTTANPYVGVLVSAVCMAALTEQPDEEPGSTPEFNLNQL